MLEWLSQNWPLLAFVLSGVVIWWGIWITRKVERLYAVVKGPNGDPNRLRMMTVHDLNNVVAEKLAPFQTEALRQRLEFEAIKTNVENLKWFLVEHGMPSGYTFPKK